ncbi:MAG TPA: VOC family protein [Acidimicrobiia bacterium]|nr:VOC family protein [Acidimicrobiia bacterium]
MRLEHIGLGVPDVDAAKVYFDEFMPMVGFQPCFGNGYCPDDSQGTQVFLYPARGSLDYSREDVGLQHLAFLVPTRAHVHRVHEWARDRGDEIVRAPKPFPQYGPHCYATFFLDPHGFMIEVVSHAPETSS